ncbi:MAG TPA: ATP-binding protein [Polyangiaceae bacterium]|nr:ATP-binding protein [Polyangiaceae bacterium]
MRKGPMRNRGDVSAEDFDRAGGSAPPSDPEASSPRARVPDVVPISWLDRLLVAVLDLPLLKGERAVVEAVVDSVVEILPAYAVGVCLGADAGGGRHEQLVVKRQPPGTVDLVAGIDPTRIFPGFAHEYIVPVPSASGSTVHVASDDHELDRDGSPAVHLVDRAAIVLGHALPNARISGALAAAQPGPRELDDRMMQADKLATFGQIAAGVIHELNNPLTSIVAYTDYLIRKATSSGGRDAEDVERLRRIGESANRMLRFSRELVSYTRPSNGPSGPVVLSVVIDQAVAFCEHVLATSGITVERRYAVEPLAVQGMSEQLVQVFVNLVTNACQAAPRTGCRVVVTTASEPGARRRVTVIVEDDCSGVAPEHLGHVFRPFFTTRADRNGTGLGLSIVKSIVETHDGEIRVDSQLGRGTRFTISLPLVVPRL